MFSLSLSLSLCWLTSLIQRLQISVYYIMLLLNPCFFWFIPYEPTNNVSTTVLKDD